MIFFDALWGYFSAWSGAFGARGRRQLLSKNAAFASWLPFLAPRYPDALFVICIRNPQAALSSQLSSLAGARAAFASLARDADHVELFSGFYRNWFAALDVALRGRA